MNTFLGVSHTCPFRFGGLGGLGGFACITVPCDSQIKSKTMSNSKTKKPIEKPIEVLVTLRFSPALFKKVSLFLTIRDITLENWILSLCDRLLINFPSFPSRKDRAVKRG